MPDEPIRYVYVLLDGSGAWRYVGVSRRPSRRFKEYFRLPATAVTEWLASLTAKPQQLTIEEIQPGRDWRAVEKSWIEWALAKGQPLLNTVHVPGALGPGRSYIARPAWLDQDGRRRPRP